MLEPESVVRQLWRAINDRDYAHLAGAIAERCEWMSMPSGQVYRGPAAMVEGLRTFHEAFPDGRGEIIEVYVAGNVVVTEWEVTGTNMGSRNDIAPTGRPFSRRGCSVALVVGGKIVAYRDYFDRQTLTDQLEGPTG